MPLQAPSAEPQALPLRLYRPKEPALALGLAVSHLMTKPAFAGLPFGDWSRILVGQINRGHYCFVIDGRGQIQGFLGWAFASEAHAEGWVAGKRGLPFEDSLQGECMLINAWSAHTNDVTRFLVQAIRRIGKDKKAVYFKRHYRDGTARPARVRVNAFVDAHIARERLKPAA